MNYQPLDLSIFYETNVNGQPTNVNNLETNEDYTINVSFENDLKYNEFYYKYNMSHNTNPAFNVDGINQIASIGANMLGTFISTATPIMKEFETKIQNLDTKTERLKHFRHEDKNNIYFVVELPRVRKEDCEVKYIKDDNTIFVNAKTEVISDKFKFLENKEMNVSLKLPENIKILDNSNIQAQNKNGALYITISKNLINVDNININILD